MADIFLAGWTLMHTFLVVLAFLGLLAVFAFVSWTRGTFGSRFNKKR